MYRVGSKSGEYFKNTGLFINKELFISITLFILLISYF